MAKPILEIRTLNLKPGTRTDFQKTFIEQSLSLLHKWNMGVVGFGPSLQDENAFYVIRKFLDLDDREQKEVAFYGSDDWKKGPREALVSRIVDYSDTVIPLEALQNLITDPDKKSL